MDFLYKIGPPRLISRPPNQLPADQSLPPSLQAATRRKSRTAATGTAVPFHLPSLARFLTRSRIYSTSLVGVVLRLVSTAAYRRGLPEKHSTAAALLLHDSFPLIDLLFPFYAYLTISLSRSWKLRTTRVRVGSLLSHDSHQQPPLLLDLRSSTSIGRQVAVATRFVLPFARSVGRFY